MSFEYLDKYSCILDRLSTPIAIIDEYICVYCNDAALKLIGIDRKDFTGTRYFYELFNKEMTEEKYKRITDLVLFKGEYKLRFFHKNKNQHGCSLLISFKAVDFEGKKILICEFKDMTEKEKIVVELNSKRKKFQGISHELTDICSYLNMVFYKVPVGFYIKDKNFRYIGCNELFLKHAGVEAIEGKTDYELSWKCSADALRKDDMELVKTRLPKFNFKESLITGENKKIIINLSKSPVVDEKNNIIGIIGLYSDITKEREYRIKAKESEDNFRLLIETMDDGVALFRRIEDESKNDHDYIILEVNSAFEENMGLKKENIIGKRISQIFKRSTLESYSFFSETADSGAPKKFEIYNDETGKYFKISMYSPKKDFLATIIEDITEKKNKDNRIEFLRYNDVLTNVKNRRAFDKEIKKIDNCNNLPISIVMADLNGLKITNDTFGHEKGDMLLKAATTLLKDMAKDNGTVYRTGGDEFVIILPNTSQEQVDKLTKKISDRISNIKVGGIALSMAIGSACKERYSQGIMRTLSSAEEKMYTNKFIKSKEVKNRILQSIIEINEERNPGEIDHGMEVARVCVEIGKTLGLNNTELEDLRLLGIFHDIGKANIPAEIVLKEDNFTDEEWTIMKSHTEIGCRLLSLVPEYSRISEYILYHHERWDGKGYPAGIKGEEIPLLSRILTVADSYGSMKMNKSYKKALTDEEASLEVLKRSGSQFDPRVVEAFLKREKSY